jgi:hypothetical protein
MTKTRIPSGAMTHNETLTMTVQNAVTVFVALTAISAFSVNGAAADRPNAKMIGMRPFHASNGRALQNPHYPVPLRTRSHADHRRVARLDHDRKWSMSTLQPTFIVGLNSRHEAGGNDRFNNAAPGRFGGRTNLCNWNGLVVTAGLPSNGKKSTAIKWSTAPTTQNSERETRVTTGLNADTHRSNVSISMTGAVRAPNMLKLGTGR